MMCGFNCYAMKKEIFVVTNKKNKTTALAKAACRGIRTGLGMAPNPMDSDIQWFKRTARPATLEYGVVNGYQTYKISGDDFGAYGFIRDNDLLVVKI